MKNLLIYGAIAFLVFSMTFVMAEAPDRPPKAWPCHPQEETCEEPYYEPPVYEMCPVYKKNGKIKNYVICDEQP